MIGTLAYVLRGDDVLLVHRIFRDDDAHLGKYNGLGGKLEPGEDVVSCIRRELREEAGIEATALRLRGTIAWPGFGAGGEDWFGFIFVVDAFTGEPPAANEEGTLHWVPRARLLAGELPLWEGDPTWLPLVFDDGPGQFHGVMPYTDGRPAGWQVTTIPGPAARDGVRIARVGAMVERAYEVLPGNHGSRVKVNARGVDILHIPRLNRGTAFTEEERRRLGLIGLLPAHSTPLEGQLHRTYQRFRAAGTPLEQFAYLRGLRDRNTVLFYRLVSEHLEEMMPIIYTPTIGDAIQEFSLWFQQIHGVFLSIDAPEQVEESLLALGRRADDVDIVIVTDSEGILGIGDQGVGGIEICLGKKSLYTAAAGVDPNRIVPVVLDVGTNNLRLLNDDLYLGLRQARVRGERYDQFVEEFVTVAQRVFPHAMIHWEDFGADNAHRILDTYRERICTFNDDVQGTAAVVAAAALAAVRAKGEKLSEQRVVIHGAGTAGIGVASLLVDLMVGDGLSPDEARERFWATSSRGLVTDAPGARFRDFQRPYARPHAEVEHWMLDEPGRIGLADVVRNVHPTVLIGTSAQPGSFTEAIVTDMAAHAERPIILPLSNPTTLVEATPTQLLEWTGGRALIATGSPFAPVTHQGVEHAIAQANNAFVFPGLGLGVSVCRASRVTDGMIGAAAQALASLVRIGRPGQSLLPALDDLRRVSATVAIAVAGAAESEGVAEVPLTDPVQQVFGAMWQPVYPELVIED